MAQLFFMVLVGMVSAVHVWAQVGALEAARDSQEVLQEGLVIQGIGRYGRQPLYTDKVVSHIAQGCWQAPQVGQELVATDGETQVWQTVQADVQGWLRAKGRGGYYYLNHEVPQDTVKLINVLGPSMLYVNGEPRVGSRYAYKDKAESWEPNFNITFLPVKLKAGKNHLLLQRTWRSGGRAKVTLMDVNTPLMFNPYDTTLPDLLVGERIATQGAIVVINATQQPQLHSRICVVWPSGQVREVKLPSIPPLSVRKIPFPLYHEPLLQKGNIELKLSLWDNQTHTQYDSYALRLQVKERHEAHKVTFVSRMDNSVQYYGLLPACPLDEEIQPGLVMSTHGAAVKAINQVGSYAAKTWCHIVSPTNRRPYGFDWEDWGRLDFHEVKNHAQERLSIDPTRVYLTGHSMGGHGTWILGSQFPDQFAAIGPSAGWISFQSYRRAPKPDQVDPIAAILKKASLPSDTLAMSRNLKDTGISILHGGADRVVRPDQARMMIETLKTFHTNWHYHEEPNQGHWWDLDKKPGVDCVDWSPMFDYFARHTRPRLEQVQHVQFKTANPEISGWCHWAGIHNQIQPLAWSDIDIHYDPSTATFRGETHNVRTLALRLDMIRPGKEVAIHLDGQVLGPWSVPPHKLLWLEWKKDEAWQRRYTPNLQEKGPHRYGPFKTAWQHKMVFVVGTKGTAEETAWAESKARFDSEQWWYQGNGAVDIIADTEFDAPVYKDRGVILYGNADTNHAWSQLLKNSPIQVTRQAVIVGEKTVKGDNLACLFLRPREDSHHACVAVVSGTGLPGLRTTDRFGYFLAGCSYPDWMVCDSSMIEQGIKGVRAAGIFGVDWSLKERQSAWRHEEDMGGGEGLPAMIGPDPRPFIHPHAYVCQRTKEPIQIDGKLDELSWQLAKPTDSFVDIRGDQHPVQPQYFTQARMLWDDTYFYVGALLEEPHVWGTLTERNSVIFHDNDFEVFIDPDSNGHTYYEFEVNALNTVWNLFLDRPYKHGGNALIREMLGQKSAVFVQGSLNQPKDRDVYWSVEIAFPWAAMAEHAGCPCPPQENDQWRVNFSRVQWRHQIQDGAYLRVPARGQESDTDREDNWVWSPQGVINMHRPETWGYVQFSADSVGSPAVFINDPLAEPRYVLSQVLYAQERYLKQHGKYATALSALGFDPQAYRITLSGDEKRYRAKFKTKDATLVLQEDGRFWKE